MINNNFKNLLFYTISFGTSYAKVMPVSGTQNNWGWSNTDVLNCLRTMTSTKYSDFLSSTNSGSTFVLGTSTAPASKNDFVFAQDATQAISESNPSTAVDDTNLRIIAASATRLNDLDSKWVYTQTYEYSGDTSLTINEIGLVSHKDYNYALTILVAREVLDSPITVNNGDTFTVSMVIG